MYFTKNELKDITEERLQNLITNSIGESKILDYKEDYKLNTDEEKKEFLADVSAFANSSGGNLIYGIKEAEGLAVEINGVDLSDPDAEILKMENLLRDGIEPRIQGYEIASIKLNNGKYVIIINIPNSLNSPHVVNFKKRWRFYSRSSAGKYLLDIQEVKSAFIASENIADKIRNFRADRIGNILNNDTPVPMYEQPKFVLHIIPISAFMHGAQIAFDNNFKRNVGNNEIMRNFQNRHNFNGFLFHNAYNSPAESYIQLYRNGIVEIVSSKYTETYQETKNIYWKDYEFQYYLYIDYVLSIFKVYEISSPYFLINSILDIKGYRIYADNDRFAMVSRSEIIENNLLIPELFLTDENDLSHEYLKPMFDPVWNACGYPQSQNYDHEGKWKGN